MDAQTIAKLSLGIVMGAAIGVLLRFVLFKLLLFLSIPVVILIILDYTGVFAINWLFLREKWDSFILPPAINIYTYFKGHALIGMLPGMVLGLGGGLLLRGRR